MALVKLFFKEALKKIAEIKGARVVLALDLQENVYTKPKNVRIGFRQALLAKAYDVVSAVESYVVAVKIGLPLVLDVGLDGVEQLINSFKPKMLFICDFKIADVGFINKLVVNQVFSTGFDAVIAHSAIGVEEGIKPISELAHSLDKGVLAVCAMTHPGAQNFLNKHFMELLKLAYEAEVDGFILPATYPEYISEARRLYADALILSPGVGVQGAAYGSAIKAGADFEIVGRAIYGASNPRKAAEDVVKAIEEATKQR
ncbi:MAG: orotidine-5'-phosphate decarboxylase [Candidatus Methanomethylicota archaeon]|uniref:Orotidine 5'-phosphate decarboxylase n=1 Tax=Thermoproteota archaeon TaxID=2056631 RepID=A0A497ENG9_9CREN|nr:MAG: orotidine-5'-phosphate decarboxylase [Candidatus Verstraetearchaeota archaeon]